MPIFGTGSTPANVERDKDVPITPKALKKRGQGNAWTRFWKSVNQFDALTWFEPKRPPPVPRNVFIDLPLPTTVWAPTSKGKKQLKSGVPEDQIERKVGKQALPSYQYPSNQVLTSKYNVVTFIPKNLLEQFRRIANIFFLVLVILQFFPTFSQVSPALSALPLLVVLAITALKDGYEDIKRHQSDRFINNLGCHVLSGPNVNNPNLTIPKSRGISFRWLGDLFPWLGSIPGIGKRSAAKKASQGSDRAAAGLVAANGGANVHDDEDRPDDFDAAERASLVGPKTNWWGRRKRALSVKSNRGNKGSNGPAASSSTNEKEKSSAPGQQQQTGADGLSRPKGVQRVETFLTDDGMGYQDDANARSRRDTNGSADGYNNTNSSNGATVDSAPAAGTGGADATSSPDKAHWTKTRWEDVKVGDFVRLRDNDSIPADIIICATSEEENICYLETKNLDGETNLKARQAVEELTHIRNAKLASEARFLIKSEAPDVNMFKYNAAIELNDGRLDKDGRKVLAPVNLNTILLRGCVLRNTEWVIGVVVFTGIDTKIVMNSGGTPSKRGRVERLMNPMVFLNLGLLALMCIMCAVGDHILQKRYYPENAYWLYGANTRGDNPNINGLISFANAMITFQNIVPISLYISIEFVRTVQALYIWGDDEIKYMLTGRRTIARSWNLSDDLGQIEYIFSDKTGTLTQNSMQFRHCTIGGKAYMGDDKLPDNTIIPEKNLKAPGAGASVEQSQRQDDLENQELASRSNASSSGDETRVGGKNNNNASSKENENEAKQVVLPTEVVAPFHDDSIDRDLRNGGKQEERIRMFFHNLSLCHTVLAAEDGEGHIEYKAQSPDEAALVQAAADVGFVFRGRDREILKLQLPGSDTLHKFELLETLEFTSARKRMSVLLRRIEPRDEKDQRIILFSKGADNVIFERLVPGDEEFKKKTDAHLEEFASEGLRTLTLAYKYLSEEDYEAWSRRFHQATVLIDGRDAEIEKVSAEIEGDLHLLGATAIEDKLQDGVPEAIADLKRAGIKVWVATGDKLETAIAIGMSSNLLARDMNLIIVRGGEYGSNKSTYDQIRSALVNFFDAQTEVENAINQPPGLHRTHSRPSLNLRRSSSRRRPDAPQRRQSTASGLSEFIDEDNGSKPGGFGLVIDGASLQHAFAEDFTKELLLSLATRCKAVICCRVSPLQKALIVKLVKEGLGAMCLAIGDGANDVSMIQAADVGVGVAGEEGLQAVNSSDYAIAQFRFLTRLLFVHGHWSYMRNSEMICNFFYKEIIGIGVLFFFQFYCAFSTTTVYEYTLLLFWNVFWTLLPVLAMGIFDRTMDQHVIMQVPEVYRYGIENRWFGLRRFCLYMIDGIYASAICYFFLLYTYDTTTARSDGYEVYIYEFSTVMCIIAVIIANVYNGMNTKAWNWWVLGSVLVGPILILCYTAVYASISPGWIWTTMYGLNFFLWGSAYFWFGMLFCFFVALLPKYFMRYWNELYRATDIDILAYIAKYDPNHDFINDPMFPAARERTKYVAPGEANGDHEMQMQTLAQQGRRMTDMSGRLEPVSSRGFNFDQDPYPRRSQGSRPSSLAGLDAPASRKRSHSIKIGPVQLTMPTMKSPGTLRRKKHSNTISTLPEETDSPQRGRNRGGSNDALTQQQQQDQQQTPSRSYASQVLAAQSAQNASPSRSAPRQASPPQQQTQDYYQPSSPSFSPAMRQISVDPPTDEGLLAQDRRRQQQSYNPPSSPPPPRSSTTPHLFVKEDQR